MNDIEINLAVARACGLEADKARGEVTDPLDRRWIGSIGPGPNRYDPRNDDDQAIVALRLFLKKRKWEAEIAIDPADAHVEIRDFHRSKISTGYDVKLSHAITDAILAAEEKRWEVESRAKRAREGR